MHADRAPELVATWFKLEPSSSNALISPYDRGLGYRPTHLLGLGGPEYLTAIRAVGRVMDRAMGKVPDSDRTMPLFVAEQYSESHGGTSHIKRPVLTLKLLSQIAGMNHQAKNSDAVIVLQHESSPDIQHAEILKELMRQTNEQLVGVFELPRIPIPDEIPLEKLLGLDG